jgi:hypothetical protein
MRQEELLKIIEQAVKDGVTSLDLNRCQVGEVCLAHLPLTADYHYQEHEVQQLILNKGEI